MDPPRSRRVSRHRRYSRAERHHLTTGLSPSLAALSNAFTNLSRNPLSLAATYGVSVDFLSSGYLDVSVPQVRSLTLCIQVRVTLRPGFPIRTFQDHSLVTGSPELFAGSHVLHRLLTPRHSPCALSHLITSTQNRCSPVAVTPKDDHQRTCSSTEPIQVCLPRLGQATQDTSLEILRYHTIRLSKRPNHLAIRSFGWRCPVPSRTCSRLGAVEQCTEIVQSVNRSGGRIADL